MPADDLSQRFSQLKMPNHWLNFIQNSLFSASCILCDSRSFSDKDICLHCLSQLIENQNACYQCGNPFDGQSEQNRICPRCLKSPPLYDYTFAPFAYQGIIRHLVRQLKFSNNYKNARLLGLLLAERLQPQPQLPECIIPVPLYKKRYRERGFNQSIEIAKTISTQLNIPLELDVCIRNRDTGHQVGLSRQERLANVKDAFSLEKSLSFSHVAIFDDVMTAGATMQEVAKVLKAAGVEKVDVWVCARARFS